MSRFRRLFYSEAADLIACGIIGSVVGLLLLAVIPGCTQAQRSWVHENVPVIGRFFSSALPSAAPLFDAATSLILGATAVIGAIAAKYKHSGLPLVKTEWSKINKNYATSPRREKVLLLKQVRAQKKAAKP